MMEVMKMPILTNTLKFNDVWESFNDFNSTINLGMFDLSGITESSRKIIYYSLYARWGSSSIVSINKEQWKAKCMYIIFTKGFKWQKALELQKTLEQLEDDEITLGVKNISNVSNAPSDEDTGGTMDEDGLTTINAQNVLISRINRIPAYQTLIETLRDVTTPFIDEFAKLFAPVVTPTHNIYYSEEEEDE